MTLHRLIYRLRRPPSTYPQVRSLFISLVALVSVGGIWTISQMRQYESSSDPFAAVGDCMPPAPEPSCRDGHCELPEPQIPVSHEIFDVTPDDEQPQMPLLIPPLPPPHMPPPSHHPVHV